MEPSKQVEAVLQKLHELNPKFDGVPDCRIGNMGVEHANLPTTNVTDLSPLRAFRNLRSLECDGGAKKGVLSSLAPLQGLPLRSLRIGGNQVSDLSPLRGMPLTDLRLAGNPVRACIVQHPEDYLYSSARNYAGMPGLLKITKLE